MRYGIFSDVHSNLEALSAVIDAYKKEDIDSYLCLGDIVGYAASPSECIKIVKDLPGIIIAGNHDWGVSGKFALDYFTSGAKKALEWTASVLGQVDKEFLDNLSLVNEQENFVLVHGTLLEPQEFYYLNDISAARGTFLALKKQICFVGHTHEPGVFVQQGDEISFGPFLRLSIEDNKRYIVNVGSVGQPRDGDSRAAFAIYDTTQRSIEIKRAAYDFKLTQGRILKAGLPEFLASRLNKGK